MNPPIVFRPEAEADLHSAWDWYEHQRTGLGDEFLTELDRLAAQVSQMPRLYAEVWGNVRRGKLRRFPYVLYYREFTDRIEVIALLHGSQHPRIWRGRADPS